MANELMVQKHAAKEIMEMVKALGHNQQTALLIVGIMATAGTCVLCYRWTLKMGYEFKWDRNGVRLFKPEAVAALSVAS